MKFSYQFFFAMRLIKAHFFQYALSIFGIFLGTAAVFFFLSLTQGIKNNINQTFTSSYNILTVSQPREKISFFQKKITEQTRKKIENIKGVSKVYTERSLMIPSQINLPIPLFGDMKLDSFFIEGIDDDFFTDFFPHHKTETNPVILSPISLDLLNSFSQSIPGFPGIKVADLENKTFNITVGKSVSFPFLDKKTSRDISVIVTGFSPLAPLLGTMIPQSQAEKIGKSFGITPSEFSRLHIRVQDENYTNDIIQKITDMGFYVQSLQAGSEKISDALLILQGVFLISASLILILSILFLFSLITLSVVEHHKTIGILRSMGASKTHIQNIFLTQGMGIALLGSISGMIAGGGAIYTAQHIATEYLPPMTLFSQSLFSTSPFLISSLFGGIFCITFIAVWFPAYQAAKKDPLLLLLE